LVIVQNNQNLVFYSMKRKDYHVIELPFDNGIRGIQRYSALVMVQYATHIEFVTFDTRELLETQQKISLTQEIKNVQWDVSN